MRLSLKRIFKLIYSNQIHKYVKLKNIYNTYSFNGTKFINLGYFLRKTITFLNNRHFKKKNSRILILKIFLQKYLKN